MKKTITELMRKPQWYRMNAIFDGPAKKVSKIQDLDVLLKGVKYRAEITCSKCGKVIKTELINAKTERKTEVERIVEELRNCRDKWSENPQYAQDLLGHVFQWLIDLQNMHVSEDRLDLTPELALCVVPDAITKEQGEALRLMLEANLRMPALVLTDNIHMVNLRPIDAHTARKIMSEGENNEEKSNEEGKVQFKPDAKQEAGEADKKIVN